MEASDEAALVCSCAGLDRMKSRTFHASLCSTGPYGGQHFKDQPEWQRPWTPIRRWPWTLFHGDQQHDPGHRPKLTAEL